MKENEISYKIRGSVYKVYNKLGPGLLESAYEVAMMYQLKKDGLEVKSQVPIEVFYDEIKLPIAYRLDLIIEDKIVIELKSVEELRNVHFKQLLTYLKLTKLHLGILVNFNVDNINEGIFRVVNGY